MLEMGIKTQHLASSSCAHTNTHMLVVTPNLEGLFYKHVRETTHHTLTGIRDEIVGGASQSAVVMTL